MGTQELANSHCQEINVSVLVESVLLIIAGIIDKRIVFEHRHFFCFKTLFNTDSFGCLTAIYVPILLRHSYLLALCFISVNICAI